jgi:hypothetical protein
MNKIFNHLQLYWLCRKTRLACNTFYWDVRLCISYCGHFTAVMISRMGLCGEGIRVNEKGGEGKEKGKKKLGGGEGRKGEEKSGKEKRSRK